MSEMISIIMAAYNAEKTIDEAIQSVIVQTYSNWELLVINDCSTDNTSAIVESYTSDSRIRLLNNNSNLGVSISRKQALDLAKGQWIAILDSDDKWNPNKLEKQIQLANEKGAQLVYTGSAFINNDGAPIDWQLHVPSLLTYHDLLRQNLISNSSALVNKDLYRKYYSVGDEMHEDYAIWLGITKAGILAYGIDEPLLIYRVARHSKSSNKLKSAKMTWNTYKYVNIKTIPAIYYMCCYSINGILKYRHLKYS